MSNALTAGGQSWYGSNLETPNQYLNPVPSNQTDLLRLTQYQRDIATPKHLLRWNWVADLPVGKGKRFGSNLSRALDAVVGGWQVAGFGSVKSNYDTLASGNYGPVGKVETYGTQYPIQDCTSGVCVNGYLYDNGYISPKLRNETNAAGQCIGICGIPSNYQPYNQPLITWGQTAAPANMPAGTNLSQYWDTNTAWVPLKDGTVVRTSYTTGLNPLRNQYILGPLSWSLNASDSREDEPAPQRRFLQCAEPAGYSPARQQRCDRHQHLGQHAQAPATDYALYLVTAERIHPSGPETAPSRIFITGRVSCRRGRATPSGTCNSRRPAWRRGTCNSQRPACRRGTCNSRQSAWRREFTFS